MPLFVCKRGISVLAFVQQLSMRTSIRRILVSAWFRWAALLCLVAVCYWPGLFGGFVFDDDVNILDNELLRISSLNARDLWAAAWSGHAGPLGRPVALLSFALNYLVGGADPFQFKLVNLFIHLFNTLLIGALAQLLFKALRSPEATSASSSYGKNYAGWLVAGVWALHPLNLTGVLYVVQRMTSLSALFGLTGLVLYAWYRSKTSVHVELRRPGMVGALVGLAALVCLALSALTKETGLLFLPLLLWTELCVFRFHVNGNAVRVFGLDLRRGVLSAVAVATLYIVAFKLPNMLSPSAFANRDFTPVERGLTESRVLLFYLRMLLLPRNSELSLYHDDFELSHSLWKPPTTALAISALVLISCAVWVARYRFPELLYAWGWFLISHALESSVFPLDLVYEHRNYFATIGLIILLPLSLRRTTAPGLRRMFVAFLAAYAGLLAFMTHDRALQWSNHVDWAVMEATNHPKSTRATYELARIYMVLMKSTGDDRYGELADQALKQSTETNLPGVLPFMARVQLAYFRGLEPEPEAVLAVKEGFEHWPYRAVNTATLRSMVSCQVDGRCRLPDAQALAILDAALRNTSVSTRERAEVLKVLAQYRINMLHDLPGGSELIRQSVDLNDDATSRVMYAQALAMEQKYDEALGQLDKATAIDRDGTSRRRIERERDAMRAAGEPR